MIHNVLIVFGQEKASTPDISNLDSKVYLHGKKHLRGGEEKKKTVILGVVRRSASFTREGSSMCAHGYNHQGFLVSLATVQGITHSATPDRTDSN